ncbi:MAG: tetratricopeptide repeat protein [Desulfotomaculaceae bacterium]
MVGKSGKNSPFSFVNVARRKKNQKIVFIVLTAFLALGLVGSSVLWLFSPDSSPADMGQAQQEIPLDQQIAALESQLKDEPQSPELLGQLAELYWQAGRGRDAVDNYLKALEIAPDDIKLRQNLALTYYLLGDYSDAVQQIETVLAKEPQNATAHYYLGQFYAYRSDDGRDVEKGIEALEKFISLSKEGLDVDKAQQMIKELKSNPN